MKQHRMKIDQILQESDIWSRSIWKFLLILFIYIKNMYEPETNIWDHLIYT